MVVNTAESMLDFLLFADYLQGRFFSVTVSVLTHTRGFSQSHRKNLNARIFDFSIQI